MAVFSTVGGYHDKCGGYLEYIRGILSAMGDIMMHMGDIMSTMAGVQYRGGTQMTKHCIPGPMALKTHLSTS